MLMNIVSFYLGFLAKLTRSGGYVMKKLPRMKSSWRPLLNLMLVNLLVVMLLAKFGTANPYSVALSRWKTPVTKGEASQLSELVCLEKFLTAVPNGSEVNLISNAGHYWEQRFHEIAFPRISVVATESPYSIQLESQSTPFANFQCGSLFVGIEKRG